MVVTVRFPFSDLSSFKRRPAVVLAPSERGDYILCQITSNAYADASAVLLENSDFASGSLQLTSYARPGKISQPTKVGWQEKSANSRTHRRARFQKLLSRF